MVGNSKRQSALFVKNSPFFDGNIFLVGHEIAYCIVRGGMPFGGYAASKIKDSGYQCHLPNSTANIYHNHRQNRDVVHYILVDYPGIESYHSHAVYVKLFCTANMCC